jgi:hypothetical protein
VLGTPLPYAVAAPVFRFPALAALAGRRPLGGDREIAVAAFVAARLVAGALPPHVLDLDVRAARATGARSWLAAVALPSSTRAPFTRLIDASGRDDPAALRAAVSGLIDTVGRLLDAPARRELEGLRSAIED